MNLKDDTGGAQEGIARKSLIATLLHYMNNDDPMGMFPCSLELSSLCVRQQGHTLYLLAM